MNEITAVVVEVMKSQLDMCNKKLAAFRSDFVKDPRRAFEWATSSMEAAAYASVLNDAVAALQKKDGKATLASLRGYAMERLLTLSQSVPSSSSASSNMMELYDRAAYARLAEMLKDQSG